MANWTQFGPAYEYWVDAAQRGVLFLDVLRERGNVYHAHSASTVPNVLEFQYELVMDGRTLPRPVNYGLVRILPPDGTVTDETKPPFVVVDPRAGHGPGIGGMKQESEIGVALKAGHPCYFIGFAPAPMPGQTVEDVCRAEAAFIEEVARRHPKAEGKPVIVANCQAGWQVMMMAAMRPDLPGPIMLAGSPLSYWAGVRGRNPMRYLGGVLGGTWATALAGDIGHGIFDGAHLVANFESLNPANTYWQKAYNVYSKIDTEAERYLEFETWWGSPVLMNAGEMQWIADNLFVGNRLATAELRTSDDLRLDLRNIRSPIVVFCSWGDNITPPQQALDWVTDLYRHEDEIVSNGQTIVYTMHQTIGHLGIFVSGKIASKEHEEFASCMEMIDMMPPGLYEAVITEVEPGTINRALIHGRYLFSLEARTLDHIRALGGNDAADERRFAAAARVSEITHGLYEAYASPFVRAAVTEPVAEALRQAHPNRLRFAALSDRNPAMAPVKALAEKVRADRRPAAPDNPFIVAERFMSEWIAGNLETYRVMRDAAVETFFLNTYGSPLLQALVGLGPHVDGSERRIERDLTREVIEAELAHQMEARFETAEPVEVLLRALIYIRLPDGVVDERGYAMLRAIRDEQPPERRMPLQELKRIVREQFMLLHADEERAVRAIPALLPARRADREAMRDILHRLLAARGDESAACKPRLARIDAMFATAPEKQPRPEPVEA